MRLASAPRGHLWYVFYGVCLVFTLSFLLFEALDIDGSSLQIATTSGPLTLSQSIGEERADDLHVYASAAFLSTIALFAAAVAAERIGDTPNLAVLLSRHYRLALPRGSLSPPPPLA